MWHVQKLTRLGRLDAALEECNEIMGRDGRNTYARLERSRIYRRMDRAREAQRDLRFLVDNHPDFEVAYLELARLLLMVPMPDEGDHPLMEWLRSSDRVRQRAALEAVGEAIRALAESVRRQHPPRPSNTRGAAEGPDKGAE